jgi:thiol-disulfide isomerase/thioredoxin
MKERLLIIVIFLTTSFFGYSQDSINISGQLLHNTKYAKVVVKKFNVGSFDFAAFPVNNEKFSIKAPIDIEPGVYRLQYSQVEPNAYIDIIIDGKEKTIDFTLDLNSKDVVPEFSSSKENKNWYIYRKESSLIQQKIQEIKRFIYQYPNPKDLIYQQAITAYEKEKSSFQTLEEQFIALNKNTWAATMVSNSPTIFTNPKDDVRIQDFYKKENYWNIITTTNPALINTPLYTEHILNYLQYYMNPEMQFSEKEQEEGFIKSVDIIMKKFGSNDETKKFALQYLQLGFKELGNEKVLQYIDEKYAANEQCTVSEIEVQKRLKSYETLKIGNLAPKIELTANDGGINTLSDYQEEKVVIVFWASWCPHCIQEMPKLQEWAKNAKNTLVLAISLDDDYTAFQKAAAQYPNILHTCDLQKWNGKIASDYYIVATPTFFVLDKERKILGKYSNISTLIQEQTNNLE